MRRTTRYRPLTQEDKDFNKECAKKRYGVERIFADFKQWRGYRKVRYVGIRANLLQLNILACAVNLITFVRISSSSPASLRY